MITPYDIDTMDVDYYWKDDPDTIHSSTVAFIPSEEVSNYITERLDEEDPEWVALDEHVFYYIFEYREKITDYMEFNSPHDFVIL